MYNAIEIFRKIGGVRLAFGATRLRTLGSVRSNADTLAAKQLPEAQGERPSGIVYRRSLSENRFNRRIEPCLPTKVALFLHGYRSHCT